MYNLIPLQWLFLFYALSFIGWCWESLYVSVLEKKLVNRGFMRGPFLPLYGCAGVMMIMISQPFYNNIFLVYVAGCIGATCLEFLTGVIMEALFKVRYWDYSHKKFNFHGYICLESSLFWGVPTVIFSHYLDVPIMYIFSLIPMNVLFIITMIVTIVNSLDFAVAFRTAIELRDILIYMEKAKAEMRRIQKRLDVIIAFKGEGVKEGIENTVDGIGSKAWELGSGIGSTASAISSGIGSRLDVLSSSLEKSFNSVREKISLNPSEYVGGVKDEVMELYAKYRVMMSKVTPTPVKNFYEWYKQRTIIGNSNMYSEKFGVSLEELKEKVVSAAKRRNGEK